MTKTKNWHRDEFAIFFEIDPERVIEIRLKFIEDLTLLFDKSGKNFNSPFFNNLIKNRSLNKFANKISNKHSIAYPSSLPNSLSNIIRNLLCCEGLGR